MFVLFFLNGDLRASMNGDINILHVAMEYTIPHLGEIGSDEQDRFCAGWHFQGLIVASSLDFQN